MKVLLVEAPHSEVSEPHTDVPPLGLAYMAAFLEEGGHEVRITDMNLGRDLVGELDFAGDLVWADLVGISCYTHNYHLACRIMEEARSKGKTTVIGGPHSCALPEEVLGDGFDFAVTGDGEYAMKALAGALEGHGSLEEVPGIVYRVGGEIKRNPMKRVKDLDTLALPARHLLDLEKYSFPGAVSSSRGCANTCIICSSRLVSGALRHRSTEGVLEEVKILKDEGIDEIFFVDPNFASHRDRTLEICRGLEDLNVRWFAELRLDHVDPEVIRAMGASGCKVIRFGIESGSKRVIKTIKKGIDITRVEDVVKDFVANGIVPVCGFMIGHPRETREEFEMSRELALAVRDLGGEATFSIFTPYPGTMPFLNARSLGMNITSSDWRRYHHLTPVIETGDFTREDLKALVFDALLEYYDIVLPGAEDDPGPPKITTICEGVKRRSFRSIALGN
jgi:radical SAM superfamily enzyme YgiQ (UPF0313 family)